MRYFHVSTEPPINYPAKPDSLWRPYGVTYNVGRNKSKRAHRNGDIKARVAASRAR